MRSARWSSRLQAFFFWKQFGDLDIDGFNNFFVSMFEPPPDQVQIQLPSQHGLRHPMYGPGAARGPKGRGARDRWSNVNIRDFFDPPNHSGVEHITC